MTTLAELTEVLQRAETELGAAERRGNYLRKLESTGRWQTLYDVPEFQTICADNQAERQRAHSTILEIREAMTSSVMQTALAVPEIRGRVEQTQFAACASLEERTHRE